MPKKQLRTIHSDPPEKADNNLIPVWRGATDKTKPIKMWCKKFGYPHKTTCGETMYVNTHFRTEPQAWDRLMNDSNANVRLAALDVQMAKKRLEIARKIEAKASRNFSQTKQNFYHRFYNSSEKKSA
ncbi:MAG: hypothetical protein GY874_06005 [Desulfobacteraceae bacterium]|nr:hypothetical protein [Desulfobacteraceae bacterium]